jgi:HlyD family secretion protein
MIVADLNEMEARVDLGEIDVVLIKPGEKAKLEVDAFRDRKFDGTVTEIANSSNDSGLPGGSGGGGTSQEATKFQVRIHVNEKENFRPGMSVTAEVETRYRTNVLSVPIQSVTTRLPKEPAGKGRTNAVALAENTAGSAMAADASSASGTSTNKTDKKANEAPKPIEVVFVREGDHVKMVPVKRGIANDSHVEIVAGLKEGEEVVSGGYKAISRELEDGKKVRQGRPEAEKDKEKK